MSTITFDTLQYVKTLRTAGFDEKQAEALAEAQAKAIETATDVRLATKGDIQSVNAEIVEIRHELNLLRWMMGATLAGVGAIVMKLFFMH